MLLFFLRKMTPYYGRCIHVQEVFVQMCVSVYIYVDFDASAKRISELVRHVYSNEKSLINALKHAKGATHDQVRVIAFDFGISFIKKMETPWTIVLNSCIGRTTALHFHKSELECTSHHLPFWTRHLIIRKQPLYHWATIPPFVLGENSFWKVVERKKEIVQNGTRCNWFCFQNDENLSVWWRHAIVTLRS